MNIQELQFIVRENLPVTIVILNNSSLGMIRHFQEIYFCSNYYQTMREGGYTVPDFEKIAAAYGIAYHRVETLHDITEYPWVFHSPQMVEIDLPCVTYAYPKLAYGKPCQNQDPPLDHKLYQELMEMNRQQRKIGGVNRDYGAYEPPFVQSSERGWAA